MLPSSESQDVIHRKHRVPGTIISTVVTILGIGFSRVGKTQTQTQRKKALYSQVPGSRGGHSGKQQGQSEGEGERGNMHKSLCCDFP